MSRPTHIRHQFVSAVPNEIVSETLYISIDYATATHLCLCGCGHEVVTPLTPTDWRITYDGETVTLAPSVGSWSLPCRSHYVIRESRVSWARDWSQERIDEGRRGDRRAKARQFSHDSEKGTTSNGQQISNRGRAPSRLRAFIRRAKN